MSPLRDDSIPANFDANYTCMSLRERTRPGLGIIEGLLHVAFDLEIAVGDHLRRGLLAQAMDRNPLRPIAHQRKTPELIHSLHDNIVSLQSWRRVTVPWSLN